MTTSLALICYWLAHARVDTLVERSPRGAIQSNHWSAECSHQVCKVWVTCATTLQHAWTVPGATESSLHLLCMHIPCEQVFWHACVTCIIHWRLCCVQSAYWLQGLEKQSGSNIDKCVSLTLPGYDDFWQTLRCAMMQNCSTTFSLQSKSQACVPVGSACLQGQLTYWIAWIAFCLWRSVGPQDIKINNVNAEWCLLRPHAQRLRLSIYCQAW